ncbi:MAG: hypothetical protein H6829_06145 [Planctomycetes bacterium]|nr:hypothetical protein [Planctomycetota bacterium]HPF15445.1 SGNH/GDSL hydrolase family protein [Planctomycetota bacterium]
MDAIQAKPKRSVWRRRLAWALGVGVVFVLGLELTLRQLGYAQRATMYFDPEIGFRSWPNQTRWQLGPDLKPTVRMHLNGLGFRGPVLPEPREPGVGRILTLGDSYNFGLGVEDDQTYPVQLERELNAAGGGQRFEVMDVSYPGWAPANEAAAYHQLARKFRPDVVVLGFTFNDLQLPDGGMRYTNGPFFQLFGNTAIGWAITTKWLNKLPGFLIEQDPATVALQTAYMADANAIPLHAAEPQAEPYWKQAMAAIERLQADVQADGGRLIVAYFPAHLQIERLRELAKNGRLEDAQARSAICSLQEELARRLAPLGLVLVDCTDALLQAESEPFDGLDRGHPGPTGLRVLARRVARSVL